MKSIFTCFFEKQKTVYHKSVKPVHNNSSLSTASFQQNKDKQNIDPNQIPNQIPVNKNQTFDKSDTIKISKTHTTLIQIKSNSILFDLSNYQNLNKLEHQKLGAVFEYNSQIDSYIFNLDTDDNFDQNILKNHPQLNSTHREEELECMRQITRAFMLKPQTFFLCISLFDKYLHNSKASMSPEKLNLLTLTCMHIACKYEQIYPPRLVKLINKVHKTQMIRQKILEIQNQILLLFKFQLNKPTVFYFLEKFNSFLQFTEKRKSMSEFFCQFTIMNINYASYSSRVLALACIYLASNVSKDLPMISQFIKKILGETLKVKECAKKIILQLKQKNYPQIRQKYSSKEHFYVGRIKLS